METLFGGLIEFKDKKEFDSFMDTINTKNSHKIIEMALTYCVKNGVFNLNESYAIYKSLNKLEKDED